ncbi:hypothetical protein IJS77_02625 [bacterium]|nr:hypothetical protein [bacterium]
MKIEMAPSVVLENLEDLYFELVPKQVDLRKKRPTYLSKEKKRTTKLMGIDAVKEAISDIDINKLKNIYLIGTEPLFNPDFNRILRFCLHFAPTTVVTGAQNINEKKARFLEKVQNERENNYPLIFNIILYHFDERINDTYCVRGDFRKVMHAIDSLQKYGFSPIIVVNNKTETQEKELIEGFEKVFGRYGLIQPKIIINTKSAVDPDMSKLNFVKLTKKLHCAKSRVFSSAGVFSCPVLVGDNRARMGTTLKDFSKTNYLETENCKNCISKELENKNIADKTFV